jgi:hypothetical protein
VLSSLLPIQDPNLSHASEELRFKVTVPLGCQPTHVLTTGNELVAAAPLECQDSIMPNPLISAELVGLVPGASSLMTDPYCGIHIYFST